MIGTSVGYFIICIPFFFFTTIVKYWVPLLEKVNLYNLVEGNRKFLSFATDFGSCDFLVEISHSPDEEKVILPPLVFFPMSQHSGPQEFAKV